MLKNGEKVHLRLYQDKYKEGLVKMFGSLSVEALRWALPPYDRARIEGWTANLEGRIILVAIHEEGRLERVVGHLGISTDPRSRLRGIGELIIYIHQDFHNLGLGTTMMKEGVDLARKRGLHKVQLSVVADNKAGIKVYEKVGFKQEGVRRDAYYGEDEKYHDQIEMGLVL
jgi:RimJ/RimL family protein N-acetyltransferase